MLINIVTNGSFFPSVQISISIAAAIVYACHGKYPQALYWILAAALTAVVTFGMK